MRARRIRPAKEPRQMESLSSVAQHMKQQTNIINAIVETSQISRLHRDKGIKTKCVLGQKQSSFQMRLFLDLQAKAVQRVKETQGTSYALSFCHSGDLNWQFRR